MIEIWTVSYTDITSPDEANAIFKGLYNKYVKL